MIKIARERLSSFLCLLKKTSDTDLYIDPFSLPLFFLILPLSVKLSGYIPHLKVFKTLSWYLMTLVVKYMYDLDNDMDSFGGLNSYWQGPRINWQVTTGTYIN